MGTGEPGRGFGGLLRRYRIEAGVTQEELADRSGLSVRAISDMERGRTGRPFARSVRLLADALGLPEPDRMQLIAERWPAPPEVTTPGKAGGVAGTMTAGPLVPRQLPAGVMHFAGRGAELKLLVGLLDRAPKVGDAIAISAIGGTAGVGKTALALRFAHQAADAFPDGQLYVNMRGFGPVGALTAPEEAIRGFLGALGVPAEQIPGSVDAQAALYRSLLADRQILVLLDNAQDEQQIRPLLPGSAGCLTIVTSRRRLTGLAAVDGAHLLDIDVLTDSESLELLAARLGPGAVNADPLAAGQVIALCDRLPLALAIAAARAALPGLSLGAVAADLQHADRRLDGLDTGDPAAGMRAVLSWSYRSLSEPAATMFRHLGLHPSPDISLPAAASLAAIPLRAARVALGELTSAHLLTERTLGRFAFHDLLRAYAVEQAVATDPAAARHATTCRMLDHYLHTATVAARLLYPASDPLPPRPAEPGSIPQPLEDRAQALAWFGAEHKVLLAAVTHAANTGLHAYAWRLAAAVADFLNRQGHWHDLAAVARVVLDAANKLGDRNGQAHAHYSLGIAYLGLGRDDEGRRHLERAADLFRRLGNTADLARSTLAVGEVFRQQGLYAEARRQAELALQLYISVAHRGGQARALTNLGWHITELGEYADALKSCEQALSLHRELGNPLGEAHTWDHLGYTRHRMGQDADAITCYRRALRLLRPVGDRMEKAGVLARLGDAHRVVGDERAANGAWQRSLVILDELHHPFAADVRARMRGLVSAPSTTLALGGHGGPG